MTKVVVQGRDYWLREEFWQETRDAGFEPLLVENKNGVLTTRTIGRDEFATRFSGRVANWVRSEPKSVSVFREALGKPGQILFNRFYRDVIVSGLESVASEFTARTGAQGKVRLPAEASFVVVIHAHAKDGSPQLHAHIAVCDRVRVKGQTKTYATHKRELYQLRMLFAASTTHDFGNRLQKEWGVRVQKTEQGIVLPDVPKELCQRSSIRTKQIDDYIKRHNLKNTPLTRKYAAIVTRRQNRDPQLGRQAFETELQRTGFRSAQIVNRVSPDKTVAAKPPSLAKEIRRIGRAAKSLARNQRTVTANDLLTKALESAEPRQSVSRVKRATEKVLRSPNELGLRRRTNEYGKTVFVSRQTAKLWKKLVQKVEFILKDRQAKPEQEQTRQGKPKPDGVGASQQSQNRTDREPGPNPAQERSTDFRRVVEKALRSYEVVGAVGRAGIKAAEVAAELYQTWAKPVWRVHGNGHKNTPGSVAKMVRDLKPLGVIDSHKAAITAMLKLNGTLEQKLRYGEYVYRQSRKAKFRIPRKSLIVIRDAGLANPKDVNFLLRKAERAKAKTLFVEREHSKFALMQIAKSMKPGEHRHFHDQEMKR
jgi:hypothetical protein